MCLLEEGVLIRERYTCLLQKGVLLEKGVLIREGCAFREGCAY